MKGKVAVLLTHRYPYGRGEEFVHQEAGYLAQGFSRLIIIPEEKSAARRTLPGEAALEELSWELPGRLKRWLFYGTALFRPAFIGEVINIMRRYRIKLSFSLVKHLIFYLFLAHLKARGIEKCITPLLREGNEVTLYSYWSGLLAVAAARVKNKMKRGVKLVIRAHGGDLYFERSPYQYIPLRRFLYKACDYMSFVTRQGQLYFTEKHQIRASEKMGVDYLGSEKMEMSGAFDTKVFHMLSCSHVIPLKNIRLIAEALRGVDQRRVEWIHVGDGAMYETVKKSCEEILSGSPHVSVRFVGYLPPEDLKAFYKESFFHLFVNVSHSEGLPVTIMEALSAGIPVMAPDIGGIGECIHEQNGLLLTSSPGPEEVREGILKFIRLDEQEWRAYSREALRTWEAMFSPDRTAALFVKKIRDV